MLFTKVIPIIHLRVPDSKEEQMNETTNLKNIYPNNAPDVDNDSIQNFNEAVWWGCKNLWDSKYALT